MLNARAEVLLGLSVVLALTMIAGCARHQPLQVVSASPVNELSFLLDEHLTTAELKARLGEPAALFEDGEVIIFWLDDEFAATAGANARYHLVVVLDPADWDLIETFSVVRIR